MHLRIISVFIVIMLGLPLATSTICAFRSEPQLIPFSLESYPKMIYYTC